MKLGAAIPVLNEWRFMPAVTGQLLKVVDRIVIMRCSRSQSGASVSKLLPIPELDPRIDVIEGNWKTEAETRNAGIEALSDCDYTFMVDSDEIIEDEDLQKLKGLCQRRAHRVLAVRLYTYWKSPDYLIDPPEDGTIKLVLSNGVRLTGVREVNEPVHVTDVWCHHLSYVRTDEEVKEKIRLSGHAHEIRPDWYERVWKEWDRNPALENLHPVHPRAYQRAVHRPNSKLNSILEQWGCPWEKELARMERGI